LQSDTKEKKVCGQCDTTVGYFLMLTFDKLQNVMRQVIIYTCKDNTWVAECPSLPGCISQGISKGEAIANINEAIQVYVSTLEEDNFLFFTNFPITLKSNIYFIKVHCC